MQTPRWSLPSTVLAVLLSAAALRAGDTTYTNEDRALLAGVSAAVLSDENVRKMSVE